MDTIQASGYTSLGPYDPSKQASYVSYLSQVIHAVPSAIHPLQREILLKALMADLGACEWGQELRLVALTAVKTLGRNPISSEILAEDGSLFTLLSFASLPSPSHSLPTLRPSSPSKPRSSFSLSQRPSSPPTVAAHAFGSPTSLEALRILANCLLLHEKAREGLIRIGGGDGLVWGLGVEAAGSGKGKSKKEDGEPNPPTPEMVFILGRILFLATARPSPFILTAVNELGLLPILVNRLSHPPVPAPPTDPTPEILKLTFNILLYYPKLSPDRVPLLPDGNYENGISGDDGSVGEEKKSIIGDLWEERLDCLLEPLLHLFCSYPHSHSALTTLPLPPSLAQTVNALLTFPTLPLASTWSPPPPPAAPQRKNSLLTRFTPSRSRSPSPTAQIDVAKRLVDLVEGLTRPWESPLELDADGVAIGSEDDKGRGKGVKEVEEGLAVLFLVMARACAIEEIRVKVKERIVPEDLDRSPDSTPLERRTDILGRMLRLMVSPLYTQTKFAVGEVFFVLSGRNASAMSELIGYGNAAGFLFAKGFASIPQPPPTTSSSSPPSSPAPPPVPPKPSRPKPPVNPMTGLNPSSSSSATHDESMTDEEKEREAERLFVLFQRLERNPAVSLGTEGKDGGIKNPVREAVESGRFAAMDGDAGEEKKRLDEEDERDEREAREEMERHRARLARNREESGAKKA